LNKVETEKQKQKQKSKQNLPQTLCTMILHYLEEKKRIGKIQGQSFVPIGKTFAQTKPSRQF